MLAYNERRVGWFACLFVLHVWGLTMYMCCIGNRCECAIIMITSRMQNIYYFLEYFLEKRHYAAGIVFWKMCIVLPEKCVNPKLLFISLRIRFKGPLASVWHRSIAFGSRRKQSQWKPRIGLREPQIGGWDCVLGSSPIYPATTLSHRRLSLPAGP